MTVYPDQSDEYREAQCARGDEQAVVKGGKRESRRTTRSIEGPLRGGQMHTVVASEPVSSGMLRCTLNV